MAGTGRKRFTLADLAFVVALCGLAMAMIVAITGGTPGFVVFLILFLFTYQTWLFVRAIRVAANCERCGARFFPYVHAAPVLDCSSCGAVQKKFARLLRRLTIASWSTFWSQPVLWFAGIYLLTHPAGPPRLSPSVQLVCLKVAGLGSLAAPVAIIGLALGRRWLIRSRDRTCEACGLVLKPPPTHSTCRKCLLKNMSSEHASRERKQEFRLQIGCLTLVVVGAGLVVVNQGRSIISAGGTLGVVVVVLAALGFLSFAGFIAWIRILSAARRKRLNARLPEEGAIAQARLCAADQGRIVRDGPSTLWYAGPEDPSAMLREEFAAARERFHALIGEPCADATPRLILGFHDAESLTRYVTPCHPWLVASGPVQGFYFERPWNTLTLCLSAVPGRLHDPRRTAGSQYTSALLEQFYGGLPAQWIAVGLITAIQSTDRVGNAVRLNRRMIAALSSGAAWPEGPFSITARESVRMRLRLDDPRTYLRLSLFAMQSWSTIEYLIGAQAPDSTHAAFRAFLKDKTTRGRVEESFFRHFGHGFATLNESWREWVLAQGIGPDLPPSPLARDAVATRLLPMIGDRTAPRKARVQAIRDWRQAGYAMGAQVLIDLLRDPGDIPKDELVWALAMASGKLLGDDPVAWQAWYDQVPSDCK